MPGNFLKLILFFILAAGIFFMPTAEFSRTTPDTAINSKNTAPPLPNLAAKSALAADLLTGELLLKINSAQLLPLASLTKILSLLTIFDMADFSEIVSVSPRALLIPEPSTLTPGEHFSARDLAAMAMVSSINDAVGVLVEHVAQKNNISSEREKPWFLGKMHEKAEELGIFGMLFYDYVGYDLDEYIAGAYGTAENMMTILVRSKDSVIWQLGEISKVVSQAGITHTLKPTNLLIPELMMLVGSKTGFTDIAGGNLAIIVEYPLGRPVGVVVLGSTEAGRFEDTRKILEYLKQTR